MEPAQRGKVFSAARQARLSLLEWSDSLAAIAAMQPVIGDRAGFLRSAADKADMAQKADNWMKEHADWEG